MKVLIVYLTALTCFAAWAGFVAPLIANTFGVPCKFAFPRFNHQKQRLSRGQHILFVGGFSCGVGMFLCSRLLYFLEGKILGYKAAGHTVEFAFVALVIWTIFGLLIGYMTAPEANGSVCTSE